MDGRVPLGLGTSLRGGQRCGRPFKIANLPAGNYQFKVWHEKGDGGKSGLLESKYKVTIKSGEETSVTITAGAKKFGL